MRGKTAGELLVEGLIENGVDTIFGLPGDGVNGVLEGLRSTRTRSVSSTSVTPAG